MKKVSVAQLKKNTHKVLKNVPVIVKSGTINKYVIIPYEEHITPTIQDVINSSPQQQLQAIEQNELKDSVYFQPSRWQKLKRLFIVEEDMI